VQRNDRAITTEMNVKYKHKKKTEKSFKNICYNFVTLRKKRLQLLLYSIFCVFQDRGEVTQIVRSTYRV